MLELRFQISTLCISVLFLVGVVVMLSVDRSGVGLLCLLFSCLHECGHLCAFAVCGSMPSRMAVGLGGLRIEHTAAALSYRQNIVVSLAGPAVNVLCAGVCAVAGRWVAVWVSLLLGGMQLLPIASLDGGQVLYNLLCLRCEPETALRITRRVSAAFLACLTLCGGYVAVKYRNFWLLAMVCYLFLGFFSNTR